MDSGAYASYPVKRSRTRRGYRLGRRRNYYTNRRRSYNPLNQFSYKKTRIGKYFKTDQQAVKCSFTNTIYQAAGGDGTYLVGISNDQYLNLSQILNNSPEFISRYTQYSYYRLNGMRVTLSRRWIDPIALGENGVSPGWLDITGGLNKLSMNFYPNIINTVVGQPVDHADASFDFSPYINERQSHYIPFPRDFTTGTNSQGLGVWNATQTFTNISGELALYSPATGTRPSDQQTMLIWDIEIELYCQFCNNTGT